MKDYSLWEKSKESIIATYASVISNDGMLTLPEESLSDLITFENDCTSYILTNSVGMGILCLYTLEAFDGIRNGLLRLNIMDPTVRNLRRRIVGAAVEVSIDSMKCIKIESEMLNELGFVIQENNSLSGFPVMLLKYPDKIEIISFSLYEELLID